MQALIWLELLFLNLYTMTGDFKAPGFSSFKHNIITPQVFSLRSWNSYILRVSKYVFWCKCNFFVEVKGRRVILRVKRGGRHKSQCHRLVPSLNSSFEPKATLQLGVHICSGGGGGVTWEAVRSPPSSRHIYRGLPITMSLNLVARGCCISLCLAF